MRDAPTGLLERLAAQGKLILTLALLLSAVGLVSWRSMVRQEDPDLRDYWGMIEVHFPGADAETVERLVLDPLEEHLAEVDEIDKLESTANAELAFVTIDLRDDVDDVRLGWDRVRDVLEDVRTELPDGVSEPLLDDRLSDQDSIVYAVVGSHDLLELAAGAERLKKHLLRVPGIARVQVMADPGEQITVEYDDVAARRLGLAPETLAAQLGARTRILPGGSVRIGDQTVRLRPRSDFATLDEIAATPIAPATDAETAASVPLEAIARVRRGPEEPARTRARFQGEPAVLLGVVPQKELNLVRFGDTVRRAVAEMEPALAPLAAREATFQPDYVEARLSGLSRSLLVGAAIVAGLLVLTMGLRVGLLVSAVVPLVALASLAVFNLGGGVLHQMSIAALVIALGMLVDNAIVMVEGIQWGLDRGLDGSQAAMAALRELALPLAAATATTLAAFVPMALAEGITAEFTRTIPVVIMLTLTMSYLFALLVTPTMARIALRPSSGDGPSRILRLGAAIARLTTRRPAAVVAAGLALVALSLLAARWVPGEFFPLADRNQLVVDVKLPEGSHLDATDAAARRIEEALLERPEVATVTATLGRSLPRFYYALNEIPWSPHFGQLLVSTREVGDIEGLVAWSRDFTARELPEVEAVVRPLAQGPPVNAPVEIRVYGDDLSTLHRAVEKVVDELRSTPGAVDVRHSLSTGAPLLSYRIEDATALRQGVTRVDVARTLYGQTRGLAVGWFRGDAVTGEAAADDPVPIVLRPASGERVAVDRLAGLDVTGSAAAAGSTSPVPLGEVARAELEWRPAAIHHLDRRRFATVSSQLEDGITYSQVIADVEPRLAALELPDGVSTAIGGEAEESQEASGAINRAVPIGAILLLGILLAEFRSFRRVGIVLVTIPLAAAGVVPGLLIGGQPFGFMSLLGIVALIGVVVNNAIVLLEVIEGRRGEGSAVPEAVADAVERRIRPILLTTATTVAGLLPLALSESTLWPPLAWAMISGLAASAVLTLFVVPALYTVLFTRPRWLDRLGGRVRRAAPAGAAVTWLAAAALAPATAHAIPSPAPAVETIAEPTAETTVEAPQPADPPAELAPLPLTLGEAMERARRRPRAVAARLRSQSADADALAVLRSGRWPTLGVDAAVRDQDLDPAISTPVGDLAFGASRSEQVVVSLTQPLLDPVVQIHRRREAEADAEVAGGLADRAAETAAAGAADRFYEVLALRARQRATEASIRRLEAHRRSIRARVEAGGLLAAEALKVELALSAARQDALALAEAESVALADLARAVGSTRPVELDWQPPAWAPPGPAMDSTTAAAPAAPLPPVPDLPEALAAAHRERPDLGARAARVTAAGAAIGAVSAERLPSLSARASWVRDTGTPFTDETWVEGALTLSWTPFDAGTRGPRRAAAEAELAARRAEYDETVRAATVEVRAALAAMATARGAVEVGRLAVVQTAETLRVENERYDAGRTTTTDLLTAEAALRGERTRRDLAVLDLLRAQVALELAVGAL